MSEIFKNAKWKAYNFADCIPRISVTENGITFNEGCLQKLEFPEHVSILFNYDDKQIALVKSSEKQDVNYRIDFCKGGSACNKTNVRLGSINLRKQIENMMNWNLEKDAWRCKGVHCEKENAIVFNLYESKKM